MKRTLDIIVAFLGLILLSPPLVMVGVIVRWNLGSPILFQQLRPGFKTKPFAILKFRTMRNQLDASGQPLSDSKRLTRFGRFLRASSLDELPELWNVLKGDMSLVGPRPLLMDYVALYNPRQARRHDVRPGITGWAQVNGRNSICWDERLEMDIWYVENRSLWLDFRILLMTAWKVARRDGISEPGQATQSKFTGTGTGNENSH